MEKTHHITVTFVEAGGQRHTITAPVGETLMRVAKQHTIPGIEADCGGACICATCHVYVAPPFVPLLTPASEEEEGMLDFVFSAKPNSRLSCQIALTENMDGIEIHIPE